MQRRYRCNYIKERTLKMTVQPPVGSHSKGFICTFFQFCSSFAGFIILSLGIILLLRNEGLVGGMLKLNFIFLNKFSLKFHMSYVCCFLCQ